MTIAPVLGSLDVRLRARLLAEEALHAYAETIDAGEFEAWAAMFADASSYRLVPRENAERGLPIALMDCPTKAWIDVTGPRRSSTPASTARTGTATSTATSW